MSSDNLPYAADAESPLKEAELEVLRRQYDREGQYVSIQTKFNYAWGLIKSDKATDQRYGIKLLTEIFRDAPERRRECLYYLALGNYKLGNYAEARRYNDLLLEKENKNMQAMSLKGLIEDRVAKEGMLGVAILSGVVIAAGVMGSFLYKGLTKRRD
ncbi:uncharacterized protein DFL_000893 [Arthrobotrys flagrans]|uniref:Mitochondrial fission 1 protein n=1 Tax=Arthrobotrys flagrans TaxID=97331 RepID=A0A437AFF0_ARTFL|nr:hypothetical protein DFL_000893 [Arthrobotrys flagrans]